MNTVRTSLGLSALTTLAASASILLLALLIA